MTRKDFEVIAKILSYTEIKDMEAIEELLKGTNPNFKPERFWRKVLEHKVEK